MPTTIITGGTRGIGLATAVVLAESGHDLVLAFRSDEAAATRATERVRRAGRECLTVQGDVSRDDDVKRLFAVARERFGQITGVVNNAGLTGHVGDLADTPVDIVRDVIEVNLTGAVLCAREAARVMSLRRGGSGGAIVNVSSAAATLGSPHEYVHYAAAKAGIDALTVGLAKELAEEGIRVNAVAPGIVRTHIHAAAGDPHRADRVASRIPFGRAGQPEEISGAIRWLFSDEASYVSGAVLRISGGL